MGLARARAPSLSAGAPRLAACPADEARPRRRVGPPAVPRSRVRTCDIARGDRNRMNVEAPEQGLNAAISAVPRDGKASNWFRYGFGKALKIPVTVTVTVLMVTQTPGNGDGGFAALPYREPKLPKRSLAESAPRPGPSCRRTPRRGRRAARVPPRARGRSGPRRPRGSMGRRAAPARPCPRPPLARRRRTPAAAPPPDARAPGASGRPPVPR